jgi:tRNA(adenine34) deaminase
LEYNMMRNNKHVKYMRAALDEAAKALDKKEIPVGAVVVCRDTIIARAHNLTETLKDPTAHAEMQAITAAANWLGGKYLTDCTIYVTLEPCAMCAGAIGWSQASALVYGAEDKKKGFTKISTSLLHPKTKISAGILENECRNILVGFFRTRR